MRQQTSAAVQEAYPPGMEESKVPAGKIHVLGLAPLKHRLGPKWDRLTGLVHKLFETAINRTQGPRDNFVLLSELSFAVTFNGLSLSEANLACVAIAREVCQMLFGEQVDEISVRAIVGEITSASLADLVEAGPRIEAMLERCGAETVITQSVNSGSAGPVVAASRPAPSPAPSALRHIENARALLAPHGLRLGF